MLDQLTNFSPISLDEMDRVALTRRVDTKYLLSAQEAGDLLDASRSSHRILVTDAGQVQGYESQYFDTPDARLYQRHKAGARSRYKLRRRRYSNSGQVFLELKEKTNHNVTIKRRRPAAALSAQLQEDERQWLQACSPLAPRSLVRSMRIDFERITLVDHQMSERVTLDFNLRWKVGTEAPPTSQARHHFCILEVKRSGRAQIGPTFSHLRAARLQPTRFSKYCASVISSFQELQHGAFLPLLRAVAAP